MLCNCCSVSLAEFDKDAVATVAASTSAASSQTGNDHTPVTSQRRVVLLRNVFSESDAASSGSASFYSELEEDMSTECGKCGPVLAVRALLRADAAHGTIASEFVEGTMRIVFGQQMDAEKCVALMNGRRFDGRCLVARLAVDKPSDPPASANSTTSTIAPATGHELADPVAQTRDCPLTKTQTSTARHGDVGEDALLSDFLSEVEMMTPQQV